MGESVTMARAARPLYRPLPRGPSALSSSEVARNQRARLFGAMVEAVERWSFQRTTIADLIGLAGVSRRAFYELFDSKEQCLLATHNSIVTRARGRAIRAGSTHRGWSNQAYASIKSIFDEAAEHPQRARLVIVDSLGITPGALARLQISNRALEEPAALAWRSTLRAPRTPLIAPYTAVAGARQVMFTRLRHGQHSSLTMLPEEALDWIESYRGTREANLVLRPRQLTTVRRESIQPPNTPRDRIVRALLELITEQGYASVTDSQLARRARLPTQELHRWFPSKDACVQSAVPEFTESALSWATAASEPSDGWIVRTHQAIGAYLDYLAQHAAMTRLAFLDMFELGDGAAAHPYAATTALTQLLTVDAPRPQAGPSIVQDAITGALGAMITRALLTGRCAQLPAMVDAFTFLVSAPYTGAKPAIEQIAALRRTQRQEL
jgi:AcrR family transcriptional regulator